MFQLLVEQGPYAGQTLELLGQRLIIGRSLDANISLPNDPTVSRTHLEVVDAGNHLLFRDLGSTSGTQINNSPIVANVPTTAKAGDRLQIGQTVAKIVSKQKSGSPGLTSTASNPLPVVKSSSIAQASPVSAGRPPALTNQSNSCTYCQKRFALLGPSARSRESANLCNKCASDQLDRIEQFRRALQNEFNFWNGRPEDLSRIIDTKCAALSLPRHATLMRIPETTSGLLQRFLPFLLKDGYLTEDSECLFSECRTQLGLSENQLPHLMAQVRHYALMRELGKGNLPKITPSVMLPAGEIAHIEAPARHMRQLTASVKYHNGLFVITSSRIIFTNSDAPFEAQLSKVIGAHFVPPSSFEIQLTRKQGTGFYASPSALHVVEVLRAAMSQHHRHTVLQRSSSRAIPQDVKSAVWSRDGGQCVQCGESQYLEFDHVIPFAKGGATSLANLQLLCRKCNLSKSDNL